MRPRREVFVALAILAVVFGGASWFASRQAKVSETVGYVTTFESTPAGAKALFEAVQQLGIGVRRFRERTTALPALRDSTRRQLLAVLGPDPFSPAELTALLAFSEHTDLLLAGASAAQLMRCFGYTTSSVRGDSAPPLGATPTLADRVRRDSVQTAPPGVPVTRRSPWVDRVMARHFERINIDSSRAADAGTFSCTVPPLGRVDTLLIAGRRQAVALRVQRAEGGPVLTFVADADLFRNKELRRTDAGEFALGLIAGRYDQVLFEEYHHGYRASNTLSDAVLAWSRTSPWGRAAWQLAIVGLLMLLFATVRFGPLQPAISRTRRSSLEHVRALATALSAARGHDEAIAAIVRGLRRRLAIGGRGRGDWREWLRTMAQHASGPRQKQLAEELVALTQPGQPATSVRRAALTVEALWQELRP